MNDLDLFSGARGWEAGTDLPIDAIGVELDKDAVATSKAAGFLTVQADISMLDPVEEFGPIRGLIASPPCQSFSVAGKGDGRRAMSDVLTGVKSMADGTWPAEFLATGDPRIGLVLQPLRFALALKPEWIAWEQVPPVLPVWEACADVLTSRGYSVATGVLSAEQYGVPQTRRRAVLVAHRGRAVRLPVPTHSRYYIRDPYRLDEGVLPWVSVGVALGMSHDRRVQVLIGSQEHTARRFIDTPIGTITCCARPRLSNIASGHILRLLNQKETAVLQSFPVDYSFAGSANAQYRQIGNAIPPRLADAILREVVE